MSAKDSDIEALIKETNLLKEACASQQEEVMENKKKQTRLCEQQMQLQEEVTHQPHNIVVKQQT